MSAPRLILKQPTGWFAAGREFTQAITILSDGAFKLYVYACLRAGRHSGCLRATVDELAQAMTRAPTAVALNLEELEALAVCRVVRSGGSQLVLEISDRFWPYQKQQPQGRTAEPEQEFVQKVRSLFLAPACVHASFSAADEKLATDLYRRGVSMEQIARAILLGWEPRRQLVYVADQLAQFSAHFRDSEEILFCLATAENEPDLGNNATKTWQRLFRPQLSGTPLAFEDRVAILEARLPGADQPLSPLIRGALERLFDFHGSRLVGSALIAGKIPEPEWRFRSQGDVAGYVQSTLQLLLRIANERQNSTDEEAANEILLDAVDVFVRQGFLDEVLRIVPKEQMAATVRAELRSRFTLFLDRAEKFGLPPILTRDGYAERIVEWLGTFEPTDLV